MLCFRRRSLTPPTPLAAVRELLSDGVHYGPAPVPIAAGELTARVLAAARRAVDAEIALGHKDGPAWVIVSRALIDLLLDEFEQHARETHPPRWGGVAGR